MASIGFNEQLPQTNQGRNKKRNKNNAFNPQYVTNPSLPAQFTPSYQPANTFQPIQQNGFPPPTLYSPQVEPIQMPIFNNQIQTPFQFVPQEEESIDEPDEISEKDLNQRLNVLQLKNKELHQELEQQKEKIQNIQNTMYLLYTRLARFDSVT